MGTQNISVDLQSLEKARNALDATVLPAIDTLTTDFQHFLQNLGDGDWTQEDAAWDFGRTYTAAIGAYDQVMQGIKKDIHYYRDQIDQTHTAYLTRDDSVAAQLTAKLASLDDRFDSDTMGRIAYGQRPVLDTGSSTPAPRPDDTSPEVKD